MCRVRGAYVGIMESRSRFILTKFGQKPEVVDHDHLVEKSICPSLRAAGVQSRHPHPHLSSITVYLA